MYLCMCKFQFASCIILLCGFQLGFGRYNANFVLKHIKLSFFVIVKIVTYKIPSLNHVASSVICYYLLVVSRTIVFLKVI